MLPFNSLNITSVLSSLLCLKAENFKINHSLLFSGTRSPHTERFVCTHVKDEKFVFCFVFSKTQNNVTTKQCDRALKVFRVTPRTGW